MTKKHTLLISAAALVLLIGLAMFFRYEVVTAGGRVYKVDRWTGNTVMIAGSVEREVTPPPPKKPNYFDQFDQKN